MKYKKFMFTGLIAVVMMTLSITANAQDEFGKGNNALLGSWKVTTSSGGVQFDGFVTFTDGGGIIETNAFPFYQLGMTASAGHGAWKYRGQNRFAFTFIKFLFTPPGDPAGTLKVSGEITYSILSDTWSAPASVSICDTAGENCNVIDPNSMTMGRRLVAGE